jgi:hypothetical protein
VTWLYGPLQSQGGTLGQAHTEPTSPAHSEPADPGRKTSRSTSFTMPSKPILKTRTYSQIMLGSSNKETRVDNLLALAAQAAQAERQQELEKQEFREEQRKNPLCTKARASQSIVQSLERVDRPDKYITRLAGIFLLYQSHHAICKETHSFQESCRTMYRRRSRR